MLASIAAGYRLAWSGRRRLLTAQLPVVAVLLGAGLALGGGDTEVLGTSRPSWTGLALTTFCWVFASASGAYALLGAEQPIRAAADRLSTMLIGLALIAGAVVLSAISFGGSVTTAVVVVTVALLLARLMTPDAGWQQAGAVMLGGVLPAALAGGVAQQILPSGILSTLAGGLRLLVMLAVISGIMAATHAEPAATTDRREPRVARTNRKFVAAAIVVPLSRRPGRPGSIRSSPRPTAPGSATPTSATASPSTPAARNWPRTREAPGSARTAPWCEPSSPAAHSTAARSSTTPGAPVTTAARRHG